MAEVKMPKLGESVTEGTLGKWLKQIGDQVARYEPLVEVVTDKVNAEIPSDYDGVLTEILVKENETVRVGTVIATIADSSINETESVPSGTAQQASQSVSDMPLQPVQGSHTHNREGSGRYSPAVLKLASEHNVDLSVLQGTGLGGRITRKDVLAYVERPTLINANNQAPTPVAAIEHKVSTVSSGISDVVVKDTVAENDINDREEWVALTPVRRTIATRMVESKREAPHAWMMMEVDATPVVRLREKNKAYFREHEGVELTFLPFFIKAAVESLKEFPIVNSTFAGDKIIIKKDIHISIAVATADALVVPVIHHADRLSILGIAQSIADLAKRARSHKLQIADVQGGTFTVNNTGAFGSILSQPIINAPQAAILSVESIVKRPVVQKDDSIAIRSMVNLCMSLDHRVLDGWVAGQFMRSVKARIESVDDQYRLY